MPVRNQMASRFLLLETFISATFIFSWKILTFISAILIFSQMYFVNFHIFSISRMDDSFLGDQIQVNGRHWEVNFQLSMEHPFKFRKISL